MAVIERTTGGPCRPVARAVLRGRATRGTRCRATRGPRCRVTRASHGRTPRRGPWLARVDRWAAGVARALELQRGQGPGAHATSMRGRRGASEHGRRHWFT